MQVPFFDITRYIRGNSADLMDTARDVMASGKFLLGERTSNFESRFASYVGSKHGIGVNSGTDALKIALRALDIGEGDEVIAPSFTAAPTISAIYEAGAKPVFVDIDRFCTIATEAVEAAISKKTKAIIPVHLYGQPADISALLKAAERHKVYVIEDCAQSHGASFDGRHLGSFGDAACFSFYPTKNLPAFGDAGMIVTSDKDIAARCRALRMYGMDGGYCSHRLGYNSRMDEMQAAFLECGLLCLDERNRRRVENARYYIARINNPFVSLPAIRGAEFEHVFHLFVVRVAKRNSFERHLKQHGVGYGIHYQWPAHLQPAYREHGRIAGPLRETEKAAGEVVSLPIFPDLTEEELSHVVQTVNTWGGGK